MISVVGHSVKSVTGMLRSVFTVEQVASSDGFLRRWDPRVSSCSVTGLALAVTITRTVAVSLCFGVMTVPLARLSAVPLRQLLARPAAVPPVSTDIVVPQAILLLGDALVRTFGSAVIDAGIAYVVLFTLHVGVDIALLSLIVMTTPFSSVIAAMRELRVPVTPVWVVAVTYRYLFLFLGELQRFVLARNSRTTGQSSLHDGWRDAKRLTGTFLLRTLGRSEQAGRGIRARGGSQPPSPHNRSRDVDGGDYALVTLAVVVVTSSGVIRWSLQSKPRD